MRSQERKHADRLQERRLFAPLGASSKRSTPTITGVVAVRTAPCRGVSLGGAYALCSTAISSPRGGLHTLSSLRSHRVMPSHRSTACTQRDVCTGLRLG